MKIIQNQIPAPEESYQVSLGGGGLAIGAVGTIWKGTEAPTTDNLDAETTWGTWDCTAARIRFGNLSGVDRRERRRHHV